MGEIATAAAVIFASGWAFTLIALSRSLLPMANALSVQNKLNTFIDDRIYETLARIESKRNPKPALVEEKPKNTNGAADALRSVFGGAPIIEPIGEQPDAPGLEIFSQQ
jgi:hypothetical protein